MSFKRKKIAVVVPCFNEEKMVVGVVESLPRWVDKVIVVDDKSFDGTKKVIAKLARKRRVVGIYHDKNQGVGGAIASGYKWCRDNKIDVAAVMAGDGQMDPKDLSAIIGPVVSGKADYSKANRLLSGEAYKKIPRLRYLGNSGLTFLTKIASGYWHVVDSQAGYTAINKKMLNLIDWDQMYKRYGQPNDLLVRLNVYSGRVCDVVVEPVYNVGEQSKMKLSEVVVTITLMLVRMFFWRLKEKYVIRDFHPLVLFYFFGMLAGLASVGLMVRWLYLWRLIGEIPSTSFLAWMLTVITSLQFMLFAMWFDMEYNKELR